MAPRDDQARELPSWAIAGIRTTVQAAVGTGLAWLAARGIEGLPVEAVSEWITVLIIGVSAAALRWGEKRWPFLSRLLSLFLTDTKPVYVTPTDAPVAINAAPNLTVAKAS